MQKKLILEKYDDIKYFLSWVLHIWDVARTGNTFGSIYREREERELEEIYRERTCELIFWEPFLNILLGSFVK